MEHDGNGWVECAQGHRHWGRHGAAGLLLHSVDDLGTVRILMQHRAGWTHNGDTWGLPGGARDSHEEATTAAIRETVEETGIDAGMIRPRHFYVDQHGGWSYTTVYADTPRPLPVAPTRESSALRWVALREVGDLALHPGFASTWPTVRCQQVVVLVDAANVVGSRPDGWWRDRPAAASRLLASLARLRARTTDGRGGTVVVASVDVVLEGDAVGAPAPDWLRVHRAPRGVGGDDVLVETGARLLADGHRVLAVSADRALRARWQSLPQAQPGSFDVLGPRWLLELLDRADG